MMSKSSFEPFWGGHSSHRREKTVNSQISGDKFTIKFSLYIFIGDTAGETCPVVILLFASFMMSCKACFQSWLQMENKMVVVVKDLLRG